jgi:hypothetical protein
MDQLISKLQYKNYEKGEFTSEEARSLEDTIKLITDFPWAAERHITAVELTGGSVTIQDVDSNYLKVSYERLDKFRLYVYMAKAKSFQYKMLEMADVQKIVKAFFEGQYVVDGYTPDYRHLPKAHFITNDFICEVTPKRIFWFMLMPIITTIVFSTLFLWGTVSKPTPISLGLFFAAIWMFLCGLSWILFANYYYYSKNLFLRISQGHETFLYGTKNNYMKYNKSDIDCIIRYRSDYYRGEQSRSIWMNFQIYVVKFKNGEQIVINSLLGGNSIYKFSCPLVEKFKFWPFVTQRYFVPDNTTA